MLISIHDDFPLHRSEPRFTNLSSMSPGLKTPLFYFFRSVSLTVHYLLSYFSAQMSIVNTSANGVNSFETLVPTSGLNGFLTTRVVSLQMMSSVRFQRLDWLVSFNRATHPLQLVTRTRLLPFAPFQTVYTQI